MISLICCYNDYEQYNKMCESIYSQDALYEIVGIDNTNNTFKSAASALNYGAEISKGSILVFLHQDIIFNSPHSLYEFTYRLFEFEEDSIIGLYGATRKKGIKVNDLDLVDTLDECCISMKKSTWDKYKFNEEICDNWHLYSVELCIRVKQNGGSIYTGKFSIRHLSNGTVDEKYMMTLKKLLKTYKNVGWICTTCKSMPTNLVYFYIYYVFWKCKKVLLGNYPLINLIKGKIK